MTNEDKLRETNTALERALNEYKTTKGGGIGFFGALFIAFLVLKLTNVISWSWWWVSAPLWMPLACIVGLVVVVGLVALVVACVTPEGEHQSTDDDADCPTSNTSR